ncbi:MAG TPA: surface-adhesin E family protein [Gemmatimonadaceae bacterium]|nr:surface-adhesin E family protein [Gemmatimonadaceae bacterium]
MRPGVARIAALLTLAASLAPLAACSLRKTQENSPWMIVLRGELATVSLDTTRVEKRDSVYRVHIQAQFAEPTYRPKPGGPAYDLGELSIDVDCDNHRARSLNAVVFDSRHRPVHYESYPEAQWKDFAVHDLGEDFFERVCVLVTGRGAPHVV